MRKKQGVFPLEAAAQTQGKLFDVRNVSLSFFDASFLGEVADIDVDGFKADEAVVLAQDGVVVGVSFLAAGGDEVDDAGNDLGGRGEVMALVESVQGGVDEVGAPLHDAGDLI